LSNVVVTVNVPVVDDESFTTNAAKLDLVATCTVYFTALVTVLHVRVGSRARFAVPLAGVRSAGVPRVVVKLYVDDHALVYIPSVSFALTRQKYVVWEVRPFATYDPVVGVESLITGEAKVLSVATCTRYLAAPGTVPHVSVGITA